jgi:pyruvate dehydrogenase E1 component
MQRELPTALTVDVCEPLSSRLDCLRALEQKILWLSVWMIHHANHVRPNIDGLKVGGHQASSASVVTLMTALYFDVLRPNDRVAVKPHASPVFHAIQYLFGRQTRDKLERFRAFGGAQSYPSRTKDTDDVDFSTGSVGLGVAMTTFAALVEEYLHAKRLIDASEPPGRMIALLGDAEFDEGNVFEALLEGWKHQIRNVWWIIDYNRQSLDNVVSDRLVHRFDSIFRSMEWDVVTLKYGRQLEAAFQRRGGDALRDWIDACPNVRYSELAHSGGAAWRDRLRADLGDTSGVRELLDDHDDGRLHDLMTNLGGHDLESVLEAFRGAAEGRPTCFIAYTIKGFKLPFQGHKDNHAGLMRAEQVAVLRTSMKIAAGDEWAPFAGLDIPPDRLAAFIRSVPLGRNAPRTHAAPAIDVPARFEKVAGAKISTQEGFGRLLSAISRDHPDLASRIVTASPDVTVSTNLGSWVNRRGIFGAPAQTAADSDSLITSPQKWTVSRDGQHIELGIAESNLFILLGAFGLSGPMFGARLLPIGTVYDPFICRGLDALNYGCYQDARFILVGTPSGVTLAPEGGAHQSVLTPLIGIGQPSLTFFEPAYVDELCEILRWSFEHLQADHGGSVYLRLSTRPLDQPDRAMTPELSQQVLDGAYWLVEPGPDAEIVLVVSGSPVQEVLSAHRTLNEDLQGVGILIVTSADRLQRGWIHARRTGVSAYVDQLLMKVPHTAGLVTLVDGHSGTLSWLGAVRRHRVVPLGVERFGQSGNIPDVYQAYGLDEDAIVGAVARLCVETVVPRRAV